MSLAVKSVRLGKALGYRFTNNQLLNIALTHRSHAATDNERLEFLGDSILGAVISDILYRQFPTENEGDLTRLRVRLVRGTTLSQVANELELGQYLILGEGERKTGGRQRASNLANALEAIIGAVYLDGGFNAARSLVERLFVERINALPPASTLKDAKTRLQEQLQALQYPLPEYQLIAEAGPDHAKQFTVRCALKKDKQKNGKQLDWAAFEGIAASRRKAEQAAAEAALVFCGIIASNDY